MPQLHPKNSPPNPSEQPKGGTDRPNSCREPRHTPERREVTQRHRIRTNLRHSAATKYAFEDGKASSNNDIITDIFHDSRCLSCYQRQQNWCWGERKNKWILEIEHFDQESWTLTGMDLQLSHEVKN